MLCNIKYANVEFVFIIATEMKTCNYKQLNLHEYGSL